MSVEDTEKVVAEFLEKLTKFSSRKSDACPHCGQQVKALEQIGRCVYSRPCGCRIWQGRIPEAWRKK